MHTIYIIKQKLGFILINIVKKQTHLILIQFT